MRRRRAQCLAAGTRDALEVMSRAVLRIASSQRVLGACCVDSQRRVP